MMFIIRLIQLFIIAIPILLFGWLWRAWSVPSGMFVASRAAGEESPFIGALAPEVRVGREEGESAEIIKGDPVFFFLHPHRTDFTRVKLDVWFQNDTLPMVELGGLVRTNPEVYTLSPLHNRLIDESPWNRIEENGFVLLQRERDYDSIAEFFAQPPSRDRVATYRTSLDVPYRMASYEPSIEPQTIDVSLRGHHEFKTYIKNETLSFAFNYMDMNRDEGADVVRATVFNEKNQPVAEARAADDENATADAVATGLKRLDLSVPSLPEGVYKVVLDATRDIFFRTIATPQKKLAFLGSIFVGDEVGYRDVPRGARLWVDGGRLRMQTRHAEGVQTVRTSSKELSVAQPYEWYTLSLDPGLTRVEIPVGDLEIIVDGPVAFSQSQFFDPDPPSLNSYQSIEDLGVDYVLARYTSPKQEGEWLVASSSFDIADLLEDERSWKFSFSVPEIETLAAKLNVHKIVATFFR